jgi:tetratricopeptide (TPR) repeat protein
MTRQAGFKDGQVNALVNLGVTLAREGKPDEADVRYREAGTILGQTDFLAWRLAPRLHCALADLRLAQGKPDEAETEARRVLELATRHHIGTDIAVGHKLLGEVAIARGDFEAAGAELEAAVEQHRRHPSPLMAWRTHAALGRLHTQADNGERAREAFGEAAEIIEMIASNTDEKDLRTTFLSSPAVREVMEAAGSKAES